MALGAQKLVRGVAIVSGQDELAHPGMRHLLIPEVAGMIDSVRQDPAAFQQYFAGMATANGLFDFVLRTSSEVDRTIYREPVFSAAFRLSLEEGFSQGAMGYMRDLVNAMSRWPFEVEKIDVPVDLWYGLADTSPVHSPDFGAIWAKRLPNARRIEDPEHGAAILWTRSREILARLKQRAASRSGYSGNATV